MKLQVNKNKITADGGKYTLGGGYCHCMIFVTMDIDLRLQLYNDNICLQVSNWISI